MRKMYRYSPPFRPFLNTMFKQSFTVYGIEGIFTTEDQTSRIIKNLIHRVYTDWLPTVNYVKADGYDMELYRETEDGKYYCEYWTGVVPQ